jgi:SAM-dependent methyltransferase
MKPNIQKNIWDREQVKRIEAGFNTNKRRLGLILSRIKRVAGSREPSSVRVLNIGIGNGYLEATLLNGGFDVYSLDPSENAVEAMTKKLGVAEGRFKIGSAAEMPFDTDFFDFVAMSEVIEHLDDSTLNASIAELKRILKSQGMFIGTCPDDEDLSRNTITCPHCAERFHRVGHVRNFTVMSMRDLLACHFTNVSCSSIRGMHLNWKGMLMYWYAAFPFRLARVFNPSIRIPQYIGCHLFFEAVNSKEKKQV